MRINFEEVKMNTSKSVKCAGGCGRRLSRSKTFMQTLNPFNKNKEGQVKSRREIYDELHAELTAWHKQPEYCKHCEAAMKDLCTDKNILLKAREKASMEFI